MTTSGIASAFCKIPKDKCNNPLKQLCAAIKGDPSQKAYHLLKLFGCVQATRFAPYLESSIKEALIVKINDLIADFKLIMVRNYQNIKLPKVKLVAMPEASWNRKKLASDIRDDREYAQLKIIHFLQTFEMPVQLALALNFKDAKFMQSFFREQESKNSELFALFDHLKINSPVPLPVDLTSLQLAICTSFTHAEYPRFVSLYDSIMEWRTFQPNTVDSFISKCNLLRTINQVTQTFVSTFQADKVAKESFQAFLLRKIHMRIQKVCPLSFDRLQSLHKNIQDSDHDQKTISFFLFILDDLFSETKLLLDFIDYTHTETDPFYKALLILDRLGDGLDYSTTNFLQSLIYVKFFDMLTGFALTDVDKCAVFECAYQRFDLAVFARYMESPRTLVEKAFTECYKVFKTNYTFLEDGIPIFFALLQCQYHLKLDEENLKFFLERLAASEKEEIRECCRLIDSLEFSSSPFQVRYFLKQIEFCIGNYLSPSVILTVVCKNAIECVKALEPHVLKGVNLHYYLKETAVGIFFQIYQDSRLIQEMVENEQTLPLVFSFACTLKQLGKDSESDLKSLDTLRLNKPFFSRFLILRLFENNHWDITEKSAVFASSSNLACSDLLRAFRSCSSIYEGTPLKIFLAVLLCQYYLNLKEEHLKFFLSHLNEENSEKCIDELKQYAESLRIGSKPPLEERQKYLRKVMSSHSSFAKDSKWLADTFEEEERSLQFLQAVENCTKRILPIELIIKAFCYPFYKQGAVDLVIQLDQLKLNSKTDHLFLTYYGEVTKRISQLEESEWLLSPGYSWLSEEHPSTITKMLAFVGYYLQASVLAQPCFLKKITKSFRNLLADSVLDIPEIACFQNYLTCFNLLHNDNFFYLARWQAEEIPYLEMVFLFSMENPNSRTLRFHLPLSEEELKHPGIDVMLLALFKKIGYEILDANTAKEINEAASDEQQFEYCLEKFESLKKNLEEFKNHDVALKLFSFVKKVKIETRQAIAAFCNEIPESEDNNLFAMASRKRIYAVSDRLSLVPSNLDTFQFSIFDFDFGKEFDEIQNVVSLAEEKYLKKLFTITLADGECVKVDVFFHPRIVSTDKLHARHHGVYNEVTFSLKELSYTIHYGEYANHQSFQRMLRWQLLMLLSDYYANSFSQILGTTARQEE